MVNDAIKNKAGLKSPSLTKNPIAVGTTIAESPPIKLNTPPTKPIKCFGAIKDTKTQFMDANPLPKNAMAKNRIIKNVLSVKFAPIIEMDKTSPVSTGVFRAISFEKPFLTKKSEIKPESKTPTNAAKNGNDAKKPDSRKSSPRYSTK